MNNEQTPGSNPALDAIEAEARILSVEAGAEGQPDGATKQPEAEPQPQPEPQPEAAFLMTTDITVDAIKGYMRAKFGYNPRIEEACKVWDSPLFASVFIPVLKKYNLTIMNLPVELVLLGGLWKLSSDMMAILKAGQADAAKA